MGSSHTLLTLSPHPPWSHLLSCVSLPLPTRSLSSSRYEDVTSLILATPAPVSRRILGAHAPSVLEGFEVPPAATMSPSLWTHLSSQVSTSQVFLHRDASLMPSDRLTWSSWNVTKKAEGYVTTYWLKSIQAHPPFSYPFSAQAGPHGSEYLRVSLSWPFPSPQSSSCGVSGVARSAESSDPSARQGGGAAGDRSEWRGMPCLMSCVD